MPDRRFQAQRPGQGLGQQDAVNGCIRRQFVEQAGECILSDGTGCTTNGRQAVAFEEPLNLARVRRRGRIVGRLDNRKAKLRRAATLEDGGSALNVGPDRVSDRASL